MHVRHQIDGAGAHAGGGGETVGRHPVGVAFDGRQIKAEEAGRRLEARIGQRIDRHDVARPEQAGRRERQRVLRAARNDDPIGVDGRAPASQPTGDRLAVARLAFRAAVIGERRKVRMAKTRKAGGQVVEQHVERRPGDGQVQQSVADRRAAHEHCVTKFLGAVGLDESAAADFPAHQAAPRRFRIAPGHGADRQAEREGEIAVGRQLLADRQHAVGPVALNRVRQRQIGRSVGSQRRRPNCHGDNKTIAPNCVK